MPPKDADGIANSEDHDQYLHCLTRLVCQNAKKYYNYDIKILIQGFPGLKIESLRLPKVCLGLSNSNLWGPTGLSKIVKEITC